MTKEEIKKIKRTLKFWKWMTSHPNVRRKEDAPDRIFILVSKYKNNCGLCDIYMPRGNKCMSSCPLYDSINHQSCPDYFDWLNEENKTKRKYYAFTITSLLRSFLNSTRKRK